MKFDFLIFSIFGRGHWMATELSRKGFKIGLVDLSKQMGPWFPEDYEGPFGFFRSERLSLSQIERLVEDELTNELETGFNVWPINGPIEILGSLSQFSLEKKKNYKHVQDYLFEFDSYTEEISEARKQNLLQLDFSQTWLAHLSHQLSSTMYLPNGVSINSGYPISLFSPFYIRHASRKGLENSLQWCIKNDVKVFKNADVLDFRKTSSLIDGVEIGGDKPGFYSAKFLTWMLSSEETQLLKPIVKTTLFPYGEVKSCWCWVRYRFRLVNFSMLEVLPNHFVLLDDVYLPWTHSSLLIFQKTLTQNEYDIWVRLPSRERFRKGYIEMMASEIGEKIKKRLPGCDPELIQMITEYKGGYESLGAPRFPVYLKKDLEHLRLPRLQNVYYDSPESWSQLSWEGQFLSQNVIVNDFLNQFEQKAQQQLKGESYL